MIYDHFSSFIDITIWNILRYLYLYFVLFFPAVLVRSTVHVVVQLDVDCRLNVILYFCRLTAIHAYSHCCNDLWTRKNQSFANNSGEPQPIRTEFGTHAQVKQRQHSGIFGFDVCGLQPRGYIAECFHLFRVVAEGPRRCHMLAEFTCNVCCGS